MVRSLLEQVLLEQALLKQLLMPTEAVGLVFGVVLGLVSRRFRPSQPTEPKNLQPKTRVLLIRCNRVVLDRVLCRRRLIELTPNR